MNRGLFKLYNSLCETAYNWGTCSRSMLKTPIAYCEYSQYEAALA